MNRNTITTPTCNITDNLSTKESEGYTQFLQALNMQFNINVDQDHEDFDDDEQEEENLPQKIPPTEMGGWHPHNEWR